MSSRTVLSLVALAMLLTAAIVWSSRDDPSTPPAYDLDGDDRPRPTPDVAAPRPEAGRVAEPSELPRVLPPEAAVEDVRDALALEDAAARRDGLGEAHASIGRIARDDRVLAALQRLIDIEDDPAVRGVVLAALGARRDGVHLAWLAHRLLVGPTQEDHLGALLALAHEPADAILEVASLGGLTVHHGALPDRQDVREGLRHLLSRGERDDLAPMLPVLLRAVQDAPYADLAERVRSLAAER